MKFSLFASLALVAAPTAAFSPSSVAGGARRAVIMNNNYLDQMAGGEYIPPPEEEEEDDSREATKLDASKIDRGGVGDWSGYVDFNEFDGGDGQMGVAGDGSGNKLEKFDMTSMAKSRDRSAKNAWGTSTGYADKLIDSGMEAQRAQQLENWKNQQEVMAAKKNQRYLTDDFDQGTDDSQWSLGKLGNERNQDFDLESEFGPVVAGTDIEGVIEMKAAMNQGTVHEFNLKNPYMGFADFRAAFTPDTPPFWTVEPTEGSLDKSGTDFLVRFRPQAPGVVEGYLVVETEDFKKTWKLVGGTA